MATLDQLISQIRLLVKFPDEYGAPEPDINKTPFIEAANVMSCEVVNEFGARGVSMTLDQWNALSRIIERRIAVTFYKLAFCETFIGTPITDNHGSG